jgi:hypothetical protein
MRKPFEQNITPLVMHSYPHHTSPLSFYQHYVTCQAFINVLHTQFLRHKTMCSTYNTFSVIFVCEKNGKMEEEPQCAAQR